MAGLSIRERSARGLPWRVITLFMGATLAHSLWLSGLQLGLGVNLDYIAFPQLGPALGLATTWYFYRGFLSRYLPLVPTSEHYFRRRLLITAGLCLGYLGFTWVLAAVLGVHYFAAVFTDWALVGFLTVQFLGAFLEEIGWRGFLQPLFVRRFGAITGAVFVGVIWAFWHGHMLLDPWFFVVFAATCVAISLGLQMVTGGSWWQRAVLAALIHWTVNVTPLVVVNVDDGGMSNSAVATAILVPQFVLAGIAVAVLSFRRSRLKADTLAV
ncbi:CPBP family intramembrane metalloprotease [Arcanobacterium phocisimile]|uniref:CPBP family intramembrane metalloprotease n=1 Tax=Arcanobacterium phocisimile TaxID=1302235 RepID=A0ABX7IH96_9ACTO|nr:type II CAAX endopeptidase family protein [Arcanobacterium phocisimile]QRV01929.1 CPBP family intramembrane metalloprotease [Arcanobacterium phocisimile]